MTEQERDELARKVEKENEQSGHQWGKNGVVPEGGSSWLC